MIINVSPHRSATQSVTAFAEAHGLTARHWLGDAFDEACGALIHNHHNLGPLWTLSAPYADTDIVSDFPWPLVFAEAAAALPDARFLLVQRNELSWLASIRRHTDGRELSYLEKWFYWTYCWPGVRKLCNYSDDALMYGYRLHRLALRDALGDRLTVFQLDDPHLGERLAEFMGVRMVTGLGRLK